MIEEARQKRTEYRRQYRAKQKEEGRAATEREIELRRATQRRYYQKLKATDPDAFREKISRESKEYRARHPDRAKAATKNWRDNNRDKFNATRRIWHSKNIVHMLYLHAKYRAKTKNIEFTIEEADIPEMGDVCPVFGQTFDIHMGDYRTKTDNSPSLDRIDPKKGYVPGNVWIISYRANRIKSDATAEEHEMIAQAMRRS